MIRLTAVLLLLLIPEPAVAADKPKQEKNAANHVVERGPLRIEVTLDGIVSARKMAEVALNTQHWSELEVVEAVSHGAKVRKGEVILRLDTRKLDDAIEDLRQELASTRLSIAETERGLPHLERSLALELEMASNADRVAAEDKKYFAGVGKPMALKSAEFYVESSRQWLQYAQEELRQLEKMYKADELTEETEEIVLQRQRNAVKQAAFALEQAEVERDRQLKFELQRRERSLDDSSRRANLEMAKAESARQLQVDQKRTALNKLQLQASRADDKLKELLADRDLLTVRAPLAGVVYFGRQVDGNWNEIAAMANKLRPTGRLGRNEVVLTVVATDDLFGQVVIPEKELHHLRAGLAGTVALVAFPDEKIDCNLSAISTAPVAAGKFAGQVVWSGRPKLPRIMPGMACQATFAVYFNKDALTVPPSAVATDMGDGQTKFVMAVDSKGQQRRRNVKTGQQTDQRVEILDGLEEGDAVLKDNKEDH